MYLTMQLTGPLLKPDIAFDISFPSLDSELRNYAESKMRSVRLDPNELNRQVFGLLVLGQFLPSGYTIQAGDVGINTVSEMLSNQLSIYLTEFFSEFLTGKNLIQGIDFDISFNRFSSNDNLDPTNPTASYTNSELRTRLKVIVNDRISVQSGFNFGNQTYTGTNGLLAGEFVIEYVLTKDRRLKIRAYAGTETDIASGRRNKTGFALSYKREFDSFSELFEASNKRKAKRNLSKTGQ
ncbi:MAG: translocation/assembly module TamB domain-containing protein [Saprospiraceae bacterium]|nr:translocation/assembly module TamB domain-containing protein [Saprospiraceae bacterium]